MQEPETRYAGDEPSVFLLLVSGLMFSLVLFSACQIDTDIMMDKWGLSGYRLGAWSGITVH